MREIDDLLQKCRYGGKRFWYKDFHQVWHTASAGDITLFLKVVLKVPAKEAVRIRNAVKMASKKIDDPKWAEQVRQKTGTR